MRYFGLFFNCNVAFSDIGFIPFKQKQIYYELRAGAEPRLYRLGDWGQSPISNIIPSPNSLGEGVGGEGYLGDYKINFFQSCVFKTIVIKYLESNDREEYSESFRHQRGGVTG
jgi:hypothetical protein